MTLRIKSALNKNALKSICVCFATYLSSCTNDFLPELSIDTVSVYTDPDANQNSAIAVDLVIIYDQELEKTLGQMSAAKYFASSKQLLLDNPSLLDIWHWELVPGQIIQDFSPPQEQGDAFAAYVFANYLTSGDHRLKVAPTGVIKILLQKNDLKNLAVYDLHAARVGTTMTNASASRGSEDDEDEDEPPQIKLGPIKDMTAPCKKAGPKIDLPTTCAPQASAPQRKPIPILTRPLAPLPGCRKPGPKAGHRAVRTTHAHHASLPHRKPVSHVNRPLSSPTALTRKPCRK